MKTVLDNKEVNIGEKSYLHIPAEWLFDPLLEPSDFYRLCRLWWRYEFFAGIALKEDPEADLTRVFYPSQKKLCELLGYKASSQSTCSKFLKSMEERGYITRIKEGFKTTAGVPRPRHFITVVNKTFDFKKKEGYLAHTLIEEEIKND